VNFILLLYHVQLFQVKTYLLNNAINTNYYNFTIAGRLAETGIEPFLNWPKRAMAETVISNFGEMVHARANRVLSTNV